MYRYVYMNRDIYTYMELKEHFTRESTDAFSLWIQLSSDDTHYKLTMPY